MIVGVVAAAVIVCGALVAIAIPTVLARRNPIPASGYVDPVPSAPAIGGSMLTIPLATQVVAEIWPAFAKAAPTASGGDLSHVASPGVVDVVLSYRFCGCHFVWSASYSSVAVTAPPQTAYPLYFAAEINQPDSSAGAVVQIAVISKASASAPWIFTSLAGYAGTEPDLGTSMDAAPPQPAPSASIFQQWANALAAERDSGQLPSSNTWQQWVDGSVGGTYVTDLQQQYRNDVHSGFRVSANFTVERVSPSFLLQGSTSSCAAIAGQAVITSPSGPVRAAAGAFTGLAAGTYGSVTETYDYEVCLVIFGTVSTEMVGQLGGEYAVSATPA